MSLNRVDLQGRFPNSDKWPFDYRPADEEKGKKAFFRGFISVARDYKTKDQKYYPEDIFEIHVFGHEADFINNYLSPGSNIVVSGQLQLTEKTEVDGKEYPAKVIVIVNKIYPQNGNREADDGDSKESKPKAKPLSTPKAPALGSKLNTKLNSSKPTQKLKLNMNKPIRPTI